MTETVGLIGLGNAGSSVASALTRKVSVVGYDLDERRRAASNELGITCLNSVEEVAESAKHVLLSLPKPEASISVTEALVGSRAGPAD